MALRIDAYELEAKLVAHAAKVSKRSQRTPRTGPCRDGAGGSQAAGARPTRSSPRPCSRWTTRASRTRDARTRLRSEDLERARGRDRQRSPRSSSRPRPSERPSGEPARARRTSSRERPERLPGGGRLRHLLWQPRRARRYLAGSLASANGALARLSWPRTTSADDAHERRHLSSTIATRSSSFRPGIAGG